MFCEKCGKSNAEGAIFCSNCSSILRSRRPEPQEAPEETKRFSVISENEIPAKETPAAVKEKPTFDEFVKKEAVRKDYSDLDVLFEKSEKPSRKKKAERLFEDDYDDDNDKKSSGWYGILAAMSWIVFIAFAAVGVIGGGLLIILGLNQGMSAATFGGIGAIIVCFVIGLLFLSKNMIYINMAKSIDKIRDKN